MGILRSEIDYHVLRASMVLIFLFFGYQKWFEYEAESGELLSPRCLCLTLGFVKNYELEPRL